MIDIEWVQHAVGHGGFHTGQARSESGSQFTWIFDCGARKSQNLLRVLREQTRSLGEEVDWLFVSHFDHDHTNGLDALMLGAVVRDVMIPYVNDHELVLTLLREVARDNLSRHLVELVADPAVFFLGRGASRVTYLGDPSSTPLAAERPWRPDEPRDGQIRWQVTGPPFRSLVAPQQYRSNIRDGQRIRSVQNGGEFEVRHGAFGLRLKPYRAEVAMHEHHDLIRELIGLVGKAPRQGSRCGLGELAYAIGRFARSQANRGKLRRLYTRFAASSNRSSLSLLSTPIDDNANWECYAYRRSHHDFGTGVGGWMSTGDAELLKADDLRSWATHYAGDLSRIRVLTLPHHGSDNNSDGSLQSLCPKALLTAHVKAGSKKHPGPAVAANAANRLHLVNEQAGTDAYLRCYRRR